MLWLLGPRQPATWRGKQEVESATCVRRVQGQDGSPPPGSPTTASAAGGEGVPEPAFPAHSPVGGREDTHLSRRTTPSMQAPKRITELMSARASRMETSLAAEEQGKGAQGCPEWRGPLFAKLIPPPPTPEEQALLP